MMYLPRQCVIFTSKSNTSARVTVAECGEEGCLESSHLTGHLEPLFLHIVAEDLASMELLVA